MVTSCGGENDTQRTWLLGSWVIWQPRFLVGERKAPLAVLAATGEAMVTVALPVTTSVGQADGGPITDTASVNRKVPEVVYVWV